MVKVRLEVVGIEKRLYIEVEEVTAKMAIEQMEEIIASAVRPEQKKSWV